MGRDLVKLLKDRLLLKKKKKNMILVKDSKEDFFQQGAPAMGLCSRGETGPDQAKF